MRNLIAALFLLLATTGNAVADFATPCKNTERTQDAFNCLEELAVAIAKMQAKLLEMEALAKTTNENTAVNRTHIIAIWKKLKADIPTP